MTSGFSTPEPGRHLFPEYRCSVRTQYQLFTSLAVYLFFAKLEESNRRKYVGNAKSPDQKAPIAITYEIG